MSEVTNNTTLREAINNVSLCGYLKKKELKVSDGKNGKFSTVSIEHMSAKEVDGSTLSRAWHAANAYSDRLATVRETLLYDLLSLLLMLGIDAFHKGNSLGKDSNITSKYAIYHLIDCVFTLMKATSLEVRIDY